MTAPILGIAFTIQIVYVPLTEADPVSKPFSNTES